MERQTDTINHITLPIDAAGKNVHTNSLKKITFWVEIKPHTVISTAVCKLTSELVKSLKNYQTNTILGSTLTNRAKNRKKKT